MAQRRKTLRPIVIWGVRGHALVLLDFIAAAGFRPIAFFDNDPGTRSPVDGIRVYHGDRGLSEWARDDRPRAGVACAVAIGGDKGRDRLRILRQLADIGVRPASLVHPSAVIASSVTLDEGGQVLAGAVIGPRVRLGVGTIVNTAASVDHECTLADGVHVGPGAVLAGCVTVGERAFIGAGAVVLPRIKIGADAIVGAGAVVREDVRGRTVVAGNPARPLRSRRSRDVQ